MERFQTHTFAAKEAVPLAPRGSHLEGAFDSKPTAGQGFALYPEGHI